MRCGVGSIFGSVDGSGSLGNTSSENLQNVSELSLSGEFQIHN